MREDCRGGRLSGQGEGRRALRWAYEIRVLELNPRREIEVSLLAASPVAGVEWNGDGCGIVDDGGVLVLLLVLLLVPLCTRNAIIW
jgi:hypothetical protein